MSARKTPVSPVRAIFQDVVAQKPVVPDWMRPEAPRPLPSLAAADGGPTPIPARERPLSNRPPRATRASDPPPSRRGSETPSSRSVRESEAAFEARAVAYRLDSVGSPGRELEADVSTLASQEIQGALDAFAAEKRAFFRDAERQLLALARLVAERVIEREIDADTALLGRLVREGLAALEVRDQVHVTLGEGFEAASGELVAHLADQGISATVNVDEKGPVFGCRLRAELGEVDESLEARLDLVMASLEIDGEEG